jgi:hypothetical protein
MKVLITGSRTWPINQRGPIEALLAGLWASTETTSFLVGDCPTGVDAIVRAYCDAMKMEYYVEKAEWKKYGDPAGPIRNGKLVALRPDVCFAFRDETYSPGTDNCIRQSVEAGIPTYIMRKMPTNLDQDYTIPGPSSKKKR